MSSLDTDDLELAWRAFRSGDITVAQHLATEVDAQVLADLGGRARGADAADRELATDELVGFLRDAGGVTVLDGVLAPTLDAVDRHVDALAARMRALHRAPRWHTIVTPRLLGNIGYELLELGQVGEARTWYQRALAWDPTNPFACTGLAEALLVDDDRDAAFALRNYLTLAGYPPEHSRDFDEAFEKSGWERPEAAPYAPDLSVLEQLDDPHFARFVTAVEREPHLAAKERLRGHALACWRSGRAEIALGWARAAASLSWWGDAERGAVEDAWAHAVVAAIVAQVGPDVADRVESAGDPDEADSLARRVAAAGRGDRAGLYDPSAQVRWITAQALDPDPLAVALLEEGARHP